MKSAGGGRGGRGITMILCCTRTDYHGETLCVPRAWVLPQCLFGATLQESLILGFVAWRLTWLILGLGKGTEAVPCQQQEDKSHGNWVVGSSRGMGGISLTGGTEDFCQI